MTDQDMTRLFSWMLLAWPNAPMFHGGIGKLGPTIRLWRVCLPEVDFFTGQLAVIMLCRTCKFPPSIAEMREAAEKLRKEMDTEASNAFFHIRAKVELLGSDRLPEIYRELPEKMRRALDMMGGPERFISEDGGMYMAYEFEAAYKQITQEEREKTVRELTGGERSRSLRLNP